MTGRAAWDAELARTSLFSQVPPTVLSTLAARAVHRKYRKGTVVFVQGDPGGRCYVILRGSVKVSAYNADGREAVLAVLGKGDILGELALFEDAARSADAVVIEDAEMLSLDAEAIRQAIIAHPELAFALLAVLARRQRGTNNALQDSALLDVPGRLSRRLADLADTHGIQAEGGTLIDLPMSQESLASMVGATRESVNKALAGLTRRGLVIRRGRRYLITDVEQLRARAR